MKKIEGTISVEDLMAYVDGQLAPDRKLEVEAYLRTHEAAARQVEVYRSQNTALHQAFDGILGEPPPPRLQLFKVRAKTRIPVKPVAAAALCAVLGVAVGWKLNESYGPNLAQAVGVRHSLLVRQASLAHAAYVPEVRHPVEVTAAQESHLVAWLSKRLGRSLKAPSLVEQGFSLVGGRLIPAEASGVAAQFMYENLQGRRLTLYVRAMVRKQPDTSFRYAVENGVSVFYWVDRDWGYALSGDVDRQQLLNVAEAAYQQFNL